MPIIIKSQPVINSSYQYLFWCSTNRLNHFPWSSLGLRNFTLLYLNMRAKRSSLMLPKPYNASLVEPIIQTQYSTVDRNNVEDLTIMYYKNITWILTIHMYHISQTIQCQFSWTYNTNTIQHSWQKDLTMCISHNISWI